ncbi:hypothetical protein MRBLMS1_000662 [Massilia sp. LMS1-1-1.1]
MLGLTSAPKKCYYLEILDIILTTSMTKISFLHTGLPKECIAANIFVEPNFEDHPYIRGTGFFAKRGRDLYYITAKHCLEKHNKLSVSEAAARLRVVAEFNKRNIRANDYVLIDEMILLKNESLPEDEKIADIVVFPITSFKNEKQRKMLLSRAIKLPPTGDWVDEFVKIPLVQSNIASENGAPFTCVGYPASGTGTDVLGFKDNNDTVTLQAAKFTGYLTISSDEYKFKLKNISWAHDLDGFSGSPVFLCHKNEHGQHYALAGMLVTGGAKQTHFLKINVITQVFSNHS